MIKAIIIDDEISACEFLKQLIREKYYDVEIAGIAHTAKDGVMLITDKKPDLIFIDVLLLKDNELLFFDIAKIPLFDIIITTSISEFAFLSHKVSALHYILKPLKQSDVEIALNRCRVKQENNLLKEKITELQKNYDRISNHSIKVSLFIKGSYTVLESENISHCIADNTYTNVYFINVVKPVLINYSLGVFEATLPTEDFIRIHRSYFINKKHITGYCSQAKIVTLNKTILLNIAESHKQEFLALYKK